MVRRQSTINIVLFFIGVVFVIESLRLGLGSARHPGSGFLPFFTGMALSLVALYSLIKNLRVPKRDNDRRVEKFFGRFAFNVGKIVAVMIGYVLIFPWLGYILSTFVLFIILFNVGGFRRWALILLYSFLTTSISYLVFGSLLNLRFPKGFLGF